MPESLSRKNVTSDEIGHVYVVEDIDRGMIKIGRTAGSNDRPRSVVVGAGVCNSSIWISPRVFDYQQLELTVHKRFAEVRVCGEWFKAPKR